MIKKNNAIICITVIFIIFLVGINYQKINIFIDSVISKKIVLRNQSVVDYKNNIESIYPNIKTTQIYERNGYLIFEYSLSTHNNINDIFEKNYDFILSDKDIHNKMFSDNMFGIRRAWIKFKFKDENYRFEAYRYINDGNNSIEDSYKTWGVL